MKANEALIAWTPVNFPSHEATRGQIKVGRLVQDGDSDWAQAFSHTGGAAFLPTRELDGHASTAQLFIEFNCLVVRDGIDPAIAHQAFLVIDEYAASIAPDMSGAREPSINAVSDADNLA